ncbi:hypothetical protein FRB94_011159 [Tulasnella sp. JGI-2019a]|nr:hypothetical protein FRB94_011159 [Tulasnella sp. JGI-2019a]
MPPSSLPKLREEAPKVDPTPVEAKAMKEDEERKESRRKELLALAEKMNQQQNWLVLNNSEGAIRIVQAGRESADCFAPSRDWWNLAYENEES